MSLVNIPVSAAQRIIAQANHARDDLEDVSVSISTGNKYQDFTSFAEAGDTEKFLNNKELLESLGAYQQSNDTALNRIQVADTALNQLERIATDVAELITSRRNAAVGDVLPIEESSSSLLREITQNLNAQFNGSYLFSGSKTDTPPIDNIIDVPNVANSVENASYYQGDSSITTVRGSDTQEVQYGILANEPAFQKLIGSLHLLREGHSNDDNVVLEEAYGMVDEAIQGIISLHAQLKSSEDTIENINTSHEEAELLVVQSQEDISKTDVVEATALLSEIEAQIQASYLAFNRLSALRLANFL